MTRLRASSPGACTVMYCYIGKAAEAPGQLSDVTDRPILAHFTETSVWKLMLLCALTKSI